MTEGNDMNAKYYWNKILKKLRGSAIMASKIHSTSKIEAGSQVINSVMGKYSFCGYDCKLINCILGDFCSIADDVVIGGAEHPISWVSTSPVFYAGRDSVKKKFCNRERPKEPITVIGNDVWIGERALIKAGVKIGDGAVIGMGSIVTKDIESYEIVAGNPAKKIKRRFDDDTCRQMLESQWWTFDDVKLKSYASFIMDPVQFLEEINK